MLASVRSTTMVLGNRRTQVLARTAFTLMEMMVVVAIIITLAGVGGYFLLRVNEESKVDVAKAQAKELEKACKEFKLKMGRWPNDLTELMNPPKGQPYLEDADALLDPWGQQYKFRTETINRVPRAVVYTYDPDDQS